MIIAILLILLIGYASAYTTLFWCFIIGSPHHDKPKKGRLLSQLGNWLDEKYNEFEDKQNDEFEKWLNDNPEAPLCDVVKMKNSRKLNWWKVLGICPMCMQPYVCTILFGLSVLLFPIPVDWSILLTLFLTIVFGNYWLRVSLYNYEM